MSGRKQLVAAFVSVLSFPSYGLNCELKSFNELGREILEELATNPINCRKQKVHLTFDDGPSLHVTPDLLRELNSRGVKSTFFVTTTNLEPTNKNFDQHANLVREMMRTGHLIANHGHDHSAHDLRMTADGHVLEKGFTQSEREKQIAKSVSLLNQVTANKFMCNH